MDMPNNLELQLDPEVLCCVICAKSIVFENINLCQFEIQNSSVTLTVTTFLKLMEFSEFEDETIFEEFSSFLCLKCISRFQIIQQTFDQLELLQKQISYFRNEIQQEIIQNNNSGNVDPNSLWPQKSDVLRSRIVEKLNSRDTQRLRSRDNLNPLNPKPEADSSLDSNSSFDAFPSTSAQLSSPTIILDKELRVVLRRTDCESKMDHETNYEKVVRPSSKRRPKSKHFQNASSPVTTTIDFDVILPDMNLPDHSMDVDDFDIPNFDNDDMNDCDDNECQTPKSDDLDLDPGDLDPEFAALPPLAIKIKKTPDHLLIKCPETGCTSKVRYNAQRLQAHILLVHEGIVKPKKKRKRKKVPLLQCTHPGCSSKVRYSIERLSAHVNRAHLGIVRHRPHLQFLKQCPEPGCTSKVRYSEEKLAAHIRYAHLNKHGPKPAQCDMCGKVVSSQKVLLSHQRKHTGERFPCEICGAQFRTTVGLSDHQTTHAPEQSEGTTTPTRPFVCDICGKSFLKAPIFNLHKRRHTGEGGLNCKLCPRMFMLKGELEKHEKFAHAVELNLESIKCKICGKVYGSKFSLKVHKRTAHKGEFRFSCTECEYKTDRRNDLNEHVMTKHSSEIPFQCDLCGKGYKLLRRLKEHKMSHETEHPFQCSLCHKRFSKSAYLIKHELMHKEKEMIQLNT